MCEIVIINRIQEIETVRAFQEHFGFLPVENEGDSIELDNCLCDTFIEESLKRNNIPFKVENGDTYYVGDLGNVFVESDIILATPRDKKVFFDTVENPREPNEALKEAYKKRKVFFEDDELDNNQ